jgi:membrane-bound lytic murein transglycosylase D
MIKKIVCILTGIIGFNGVFAQSIVSENTSFLASIDSNTIKLRNKLFPTVWQGDLNIYGFESDEIPVYSDQDIKNRLSLLESEIPLDYNEQVRPYIDLYTVRKRKLLAKVLTLSKLYFPTIEEIFDREGIPLEMKYLAVIESALNHAATSPVGAAGMWQFMAPTGHMYGLKTTNNLDERRDFIKSTEASVKYFKNSYRVYGDWLLVIASYNCGVGNVNKAIRKSGGKRNFWAIMPYLPRETRGYVPAFIAAAYAMNYASEHNIYPADLELNYHTDTIQVDNRYWLYSIYWK